MELTCLIKADFAGDQMNEVTPPIPVPDGYSRMQKNWPDNLTDESARQVWSIIERLNMSRAAALADRLLQRAIEEGRLQEDSMLTPAQVAAL